MAAPSCPTAAHPGGLRCIHLAATSRWQRRLARVSLQWHQLHQRQRCRRLARRWAPGRVMEAEQPALRGSSAAFYVYFVAALLSMGYATFLACQLKRYLGFSLMVVLAFVLAFDNLVVGVVIDANGSLPEDLLRTRFAIASACASVLAVAAATRRRLRRPRQRRSHTAAAHRLSSTPLPHYHV